MTCPIEVTDYESSLIAADWYEEQRIQEIADEIRDMLRQPLEQRIHTVTSYRHIDDYKRSYCRSKANQSQGSWVVSSSGPSYYSSSGANSGITSHSHSCSRRHHQ